MQCYILLAASLFIIALIIITYLYKLKGKFIAIVALLACVLFICVYFIKKKDTDQNKACIIGKNKTYNGFISGGCFDIWHVLHFLYWILIGLMVPDMYTHVFVLSVGWETAEHLYFKHKKVCNSIFCGRIEDIALNMGGYYLGNLLYQFRER